MLTGIVGDRRLGAGNRIMAAVERGSLREDAR